VQTCIMQNNVQNNTFMYDKSTNHASIIMKGGYSLGHKGKCMSFSKCHLLMSIHLKLFQDLPLHLSAALLT